jgi:HTH-type transcriptional regulator, sugar sensing transcriptional regulator
MDRDKKELISLLGQLDISTNEAETYLALLQIDSVSIRKIAAHTGINRGTTYEALKRLLVIGLVSVKRSGKREQYTAESPEKIFDIIRDKRRDLLDASENAKKIVPHLLAHNVQATGRPLVRYYEGDEGIALILKDVLSTCVFMAHPLYYAYSSSPVRQFLYRNFPQFTERRIAEDIKVKVIAVGEGGEIAEKSERKWLPNPPEGGISSYTLIYGNKHAVISIASDETPYGVVVEDAGAAAMQRLLFEQLWNTL